MIVTLLRNAQTIHALVKPTSIRRERWKMIKSAVLAAVTAVGLGAAAEAATVTFKRYDFQLRFLGTSYDQAHVETADGTVLASGTIGASEERFGIQPTLFPHLAAGDLVHFRAKVAFSDPPNYDFDPLKSPYSNGGFAPKCSVSTVECGLIDQTGTNDSSVWLAWDDRLTISFRSEVGEELQWDTWFWNYRMGLFDDGTYWGYGYETAHFQLVAELAPVPLPASAALLPLGFGALAMMRKRRRKTS